MLDSTVVLLLVILLFVILVLYVAPKRENNQSFTTSTEAPRFSHRLNLALFPVQQIIPDKIVATRYQPTNLEACKSLFRSVEAAGRTPFGYEQQFGDVLEKETHQKHLLWNQGTLIGFGALFSNVAEPTPEADEPQPLNAFGCCFGIIHPEWHRKRLGRVLLALRAIAACEMNGHILSLSATDFSKTYYEMLGLTFQPDDITLDDNGARHHPGFIVIDTTDTAHLRSFLRANGIEIPQPS